MFFPLESRLKPHWETAYLHLSSWHEAEAIKCHQLADLKTDVTEHAFSANLLATQAREGGRLPEDLHSGKLILLGLLPS